MDMTPAPALVAPSSPVPDIGPRARLGDVLVGFSLPFRAWRLIRAHRSLSRLSLLMAAVTLVVLVALVVLVVGFTDDLVSLLFPRPESGWLKPLWWLAVGLSGVLLYVVGAVVLPPAVLAPLQDPLSEATEEVCGDFRAPSFSLKGLVRGTLSGLAHTLVTLVALGAGLLLLLPLHLVPGAGSILYSLLGSLWAMLWLAGEHLGGPLARHLYPIATLWGLLRTRPALCLGFGAAVHLLLLVPVLNAFFLPLAIVGATLLYRGLRAGGGLPPPPSASRA